VKKLESERVFKWEDGKVFLGRKSYIDGNIFI